MLLRPVLYSHKKKMIPFAHEKIYLFNYLIDVYIILKNISLIRRQQASWREETGQCPGEAHNHLLVARKPSDWKPQRIQRDSRVIALQLRTDWLGHTGPWNKYINLGALTEAWEEGMVVERQENKWTEAWLDIKTWLFAWQLCQNPPVTSAMF